MTFQALSQDLLHVSERLESLEDQVQRSSSERQNGGVTMEELEEERDMLKKRREALDVQLKNNSMLTVEVRINGTLYVRVVLSDLISQCFLIIHSVHPFSFMSVFM